MSEVPLSPFTKDHNKVALSDCCFIRTKLVEKRCVAVLELRSKPKQPSKKGLCSISYCGLLLVSKKLFFNLFHCQLTLITWTLGEGRRLTFENFRL